VKQSGFRVGEQSGGSEAVSTELTRFAVEQSSLQQCHSFAEAANEYQNKARWAKAASISHIVLTAVFEIT